MGGVLTGFFSLGRRRRPRLHLARHQVLGPGADRVLSKLTFFAATPALMFRTLAGADVGAVFSSGALVTVTTSVTMAAAYVLLVTVLLRRRGAEVTIGALTASYVNAGNLGIPILVFAVGDAAAIAPVLLLQLLVMVPVAFTVLDRQTGRRGVSRLAALTGAAAQPAGPRRRRRPRGGSDRGEAARPRPLPVDILADMAVPVMLIAFGPVAARRPPAGAW